MIKEDEPSEQENVSNESGDKLVEEELDPRIQVELENLNNATDLINKLEIELDDERAKFSSLFADSAPKINDLSKKLHKWIELARPYHECLSKSLEIQAETQKSALNFERAANAHIGAKDMVLRAEEGMKKGSEGFDTMWQEMLNLATIKVNQAENERIISKLEHERTSMAYYKIEQEVRDLYKKFKKPITKSQQFFDLKTKLQLNLEEQKHKIWRLEEKMLKIKLGYTTALHALEKISEEIHERRKANQSSKHSQQVCNDLPDVVESTQSVAASPNLKPALS